MSNISPESFAQLEVLKKELSMYGGYDKEEPTEQLKARIFAQALGYFFINRDMRLSKFFASRRCGQLKKVGLSESEADAEQLLSEYSDIEDFDNLLLKPVDSRDSETLRGVRKHQALLEPIGDMNEKPGMTVCVPVAILGEETETICRMMQQIKKSTDSVPGGIRVLLWANAKYTDDNMHDVERDSKERYAKLREVLQEYTNELQVTTALELLPVDTFKMSSLRGHYMDALVGEALDGKIGVDHPIVWLDADTTYLSKGALGDISQQLSEQPCGFVHPDTDYSLEWTDGIRAKDMDYASRALLIDEMARRASKRSVISNKQGVTERLYPEESGMSFNLFTYLVAGGLDTDDPLNETINLMHNYERFFGSALFLSNLPGDILRVYGESPSRLMRDSVVWLDRAKIRISGRRIYEGIKSHGSESLVSRTSSVGDDYVLFNDLEQSTKASPTVDDAELSVLLKRFRDKAGRNLAGKVVKRMLDNPNLHMKN